MKKILIFIFCLMIFMSCVDGKGICQVNYSVVYPDTVITYDTIFNYEWAGENDYTHIPYASSYKGTNYIKLGYHEFARTTCPIRINSYKSISKSK